MFQEVFSLRFNKLHFLPSCEILMCITYFQGHKVSNLGKGLCLLSLFVASLVVVTESEQLWGTKVTS